MIRQLIVMALLAATPSLLRGEEAESPAQQEINLTYSFAEDLLEAGDWFRAVGEYKRTLFLMGHTAASLSGMRPDDPGYPIQLRIGVALLMADQHRAASDVFYALREAAEGDANTSAQLDWWLANAYTAANDPGWAARRYQSAAELLPGTPLGRMSAYQHGWSLMATRDFVEARTRFDALAGDPALGIKAKAMSQGIDALDTLPYYRPWLAGTLSALLPGAGQVYVGEYYDGGMALLVNGLFIWGLVYAFMNDNIPLGIILSFFESGWYTGNIYAAINYAERSNRHAEEQHIAGLRSRHGPPEGRELWRLFHLEWQF